MDGSNSEQLNLFMAAVHCFVHCTVATALSILAPLFSSCHSCAERSGSVTVTKAPCITDKPAGGDSSRTEDQGDK